MTRRSAFSIALALTTLVTFALVSISVRAGFFGLGGDSGGAQPSTAQAAQLNSQTHSYELSLAPATDSPTPRVTTEYVYYDDGTYGPAPDAAAGASGIDGAAPSDANGDSQNLDGPKQTGSPANEAPQPLPERGERSTPTPVLTASPHPAEHLPELTPTATPTPTAPHQEPADDPQPEKTTAPHETQEPRETEKPQATAEPRETQPPRETQEPQQTQEPHDD